MLESVVCVWAFQVLIAIPNKVWSQPASQIERTTYTEVVKTERVEVGCGSGYIQ